MNATTVTTSGTVTKKPVIKVRRSQDNTSQPACGNRGEKRDAGSDAIPRERRETRPADELDERPDDNERGQKRHHETHADFDRALRRQEMPDLPGIMREGSHHRRHRHEERELGGRTLTETEQHPADNRGSRPRDARHHCKSLADADTESPDNGSVASVGDDDLRPPALDDQHDDAADDERRGNRLKTFEQHRLYEIGEKEAGNHGWNERRKNGRGKTPRLGPRREPGHRFDQTRPVQPHAGEDWSDVDKTPANAAG